MALTQSDVQNIINTNVTTNGQNKNTGAGLDAALTTLNEAIFSNAGPVEIGTDDGIGEVGTTLLKVVSDAVVISGSSAGASDPILVLRNNDKTSPSGTGQGGSLYFQGYNSAATPGLVSVAYINGGIITRTAGSEAGDIDIGVMRAGVIDIPMAFDGSGPNIRPEANAVWDIGTTSLRYLNLWLDQTLYASAVSLTGAFSVLSGASPEFRIADLGTATASVTFYENNSTLAYQFGNESGAFFAYDALNTRYFIRMNATANVLELGATGTTLAVLGTLQTTPVHFAALPSSPALGMIACVDNSSVNTWGGTADGSGSDKVLVWYNGSAWTVIGK